MSEYFERIIFDLNKRIQELEQRLIEADAAVEHLEILYGRQLELVKYYEIKNTKLVETLEKVKNMNDDEAFGFARMIATATLKEVKGDN